MVAEDGEDPTNRLVHPLQANHAVWQLGGVRNGAEPPHAGRGVLVVGGKRLHGSNESEMAYFIWQQGAEQQNFKLAQFICFAPVEEL